MSKSSDADAPLRQDASRASPAAGGPERAPRDRSTGRAERERTPGRRHLTIASVALLLFAVVSAAAWLAALARVPLSVAYPFNALGYIVILTASVVLLHERANVLTWVGSLMVVSGLLIVVLTKP